VWRGPRDARRKGMKDEGKMAGEIKEGVAHREAGLLGNRGSYLTNQEHGDLAAPDV